MVLTVSLSQSHQTTILPVPANSHTHAHHSPPYHSLPVAPCIASLCPQIPLLTLCPAHTHMKWQHGYPRLHRTSYLYTLQMIPIYTPIPTTKTCRVHLCTPIPACTNLYLLLIATIMLNQLFPLQSNPLLPSSCIGLLHTCLPSYTLIAQSPGPSTHAYPPQHPHSHPPTPVLPQIVPGYMHTLTHSCLHTRPHTLDYHPLLGTLAPSYTHYSHSHS